MSFFYFYFCFPCPPFSLFLEVIICFDLGTTFLGSEYFCILFSRVSASLSLSPRVACSQVQATHTQHIHAAHTHTRKRRGFRAEKQGFSKLSYLRSFSLFCRETASDRICRINTISFEQASSSSLACSTYHSASALASQEKKKKGEENELI